MSRWEMMAYIIERKNRFYVVAYDGIDTPPGENAGLASRGSQPSRRGSHLRQARRHPGSRHAITAGQLTFGRYLTERFLPMRRNRLQSTTAYRYEWMIDHYIAPALGPMPLRPVRAEHLDRLYADLLTDGGVKRSRSGTEDASRDHPVRVHPSRPPDLTTAGTRARRTAPDPAPPAQRLVLDRRTTR
ncbi:MAG: hypothetical protein IPG46_20070 [Actinobacteria bacterium]|nr:hypothetical protein [Actinomycetota bacterium]